MKADGLKRRALLQGGSIALLLGIHEIARGATIVAVRVWPASDYTRVTIESDGRLNSQQLVVGSQEQAHSNEGTPHAGPTGHH